MNRHIINNENKFYPPACFRELTSHAAISSAQEEVAQIQADIESAKMQLEYLISPDVMYWETEQSKAERISRTQKKSRRVGIGCGRTKET